MRWVAMNNFVKEHCVSLSTQGAPVFLFFESMDKNESKEAIIFDKFVKLCECLNGDQNVA